MTSAKCFNPSTNRCCFHATSPLFSLSSPTPLSVSIAYVSSQRLPVSYRGASPACTTYYYSISSSLIDSAASSSQISAVSDSARMSFETPPAGMFEGVNMDDLGMDEAYLRIYNDDFPGSAAYLYGRSENCDKCPFESYGVVRRNTGWSIWPDRWIGLNPMRIWCSAISVNFTIIYAEPNRRWRRIHPI